MVNRQGARGYIFVETVVAMGLLSVSMLVIQGAVRQAIITRGQAQDFTTARFLLEEVMAERELQPEMPEGSGSGRFDPPNARFAYEWELSKVKVPRPQMPPDLSKDEIEQFKKMFKGYMGKLVATVRWSRAGQEREAVGETLLKPEQLWLPEGQR